MRMRRHCPRRREFRPAVYVVREVHTRSQNDCLFWRPKVTFQSWIEEQIEWAVSKARESWKVAPNSYGSGYDRGYADALIDAKHEADISSGDRK